MAFGESAQENSNFPSRELIAATSAMAGAFGAASEVDCKQVLTNPASGLRHRLIWPGSQRSAGSLAPLIGDHILKHKHTAAAAA